MKCEDGIVLLDNKSVDLVVTSPPYNVNLGNNKSSARPYDLYNDNKEHQEFIDWLQEVFGLLYSKIKSGGRLCINIGNQRNGAVPTASDVTQFMSKKLGYIPYTFIVFDKSQTGRRTAWGSFQSPSSPSFPTPFEFILVFCKDNKKLQWKGKTDLTKEEFINWTLPLWKFTSETRMKKYGHPAMFPEELPKRCIKMFSWIGATVLDPFAGAGTTLKVAKELNRNYIGFEISKNYCDITEKRLNGTLKL